MWASAVKSEEALGSQIQKRGGKGNANPVEFPKFWIESSWCFKNIPLTPYFLKGRSEGFLRSGFAIFGKAASEGVSCTVLLDVHAVTFPVPTLLDL